MEKSKASMIYILSYRNNTRPFSKVRIHDIAMTRESKNIELNSDERDRYIPRCENYHSDPERSLQDM